jgi:penicillin-binding protein 1B
MTPVQVAEIYGTLANGGFRTPQRAVRSVVDGLGEPLERYPIEVEQAFNPALVHQLNQGLVEVLRRGTGRGAQLPPELVAAGKTGTSDGFRDNWFAGFSGQHVAVVWIGYDDNRPTGFTGSTAALPVWADIIGALDSGSWVAGAPQSTETRWVQYETGLEVSSRCQDAVALALPPNTALRRGPRCGIDLRRLTERTKDWLNDIVD